MALEQPRSRPKDKTGCVYAGCDYPRKACIGACKDDQNAAAQVSTEDQSRVRSAPVPAAPSGTPRCDQWERDYDFSNKYGNVYATAYHDALALARLLERENAELRCRVDLPKLLEIIRHNESIDEHGDPAGPQPETQWEVGYAAGVRVMYRFLCSALARSGAPDKRGT